MISKQSKIEWPFESEKEAQKCTQENKILFEDIVKYFFDIKTLKTRKMDRLDFHQVSVWDLEGALTYAYLMGKNSNKKKVIKEDQSKNGVKVIIHRDENGSTVECDCECFGNPGRCHSNEYCPVYINQFKCGNCNGEGCSMCMP